MAKFRMEYAMKEDQKERLELAYKCARADKQMAQIYLQRVMSDRKQQRDKNKFSHDENECIFVANRFSTVTCKRELALDYLNKDSEELFGKVKIQL